EKMGMVLSLFEPTDIEQDTLFISNLKDDKTIPIFSQTVLKDQQGKKRTGNISTLQYLFEFLDAYDFGAEGGEEIQEDSKTLINASVLGLIFEKINGYKDGSFFTPGFITMYMCRETIRKDVVQKFNETKKWHCTTLEELYDKIEDRKEANRIVNSIKICDPAVGSGHFLVSALNEMIAVKNDLKILQDRDGKRLKEYQVEVVNDELIVTDEEGELFEYNPSNKESQRIQETLFHEKQTIIENCLFGVDINSNSVKICRLRLWIELLKNAYYISSSPDKGRWSQTGGVNNSTQPPQSSSPDYSPPYEGGVAQRAGVVEQLNNLPHLKTFRKELRNNLTPAEAKLWTLLKGKQMAGRKFRRQHSVANYILDFYCPEERIAIELDGQGHFEATQAEYDREREFFLETVGIRVLRFENKWVWDNPEGLLETVKSYFGKQPPQSSSPDKGRWSQTGGVNNSTQPPRPSDTPPYKGGELLELQTLPNIDINIKCGNSLVSRFAIDADLKQALKKSKWTIDSYRIAVATYRNAESKEQKREMERLIAGIKSDFRSEISANDPKVKKLRKLSGDLYQMTNQGQLFEMSQKEKAEWNNRVQQLTQEINKLEAEIEEIKSNRIFENAFEWRFEFPEVLNDDGDFVGFDVVIGNPPYMRVQEIQASQPTQKLYYESQYQNAKASYDLANIFFELAVNISGKNSKNAYIFPHKFFNAASSEVFRNYLKKGQYIDVIAHFGANMIFEDADTYTCVAQFSKNPSQGFFFQRFPFKSDFKTLMLDKSLYTFITYEMLEKASSLYGSNQWILFDDKVGFKVFEKIYANSKLFSDAFEGIFVGLQTSRDDLYVFECIGKNDFKLKVPISGKEYQLERDLFKPFLMGKDVQRYSYLETNRYVFFPYEIRNGNAEVVSIEEIKTRFPKTYAYVSDHENIFKARESGKAGKMQHWHTYIYPKNLNKFEQPKLSSMEICANHPNVTLNHEKLYHTTKAYSWVKKEATKESYEYLLAIANSKLLWWFLKTTGDTLQGDARTFKTNYLNPFPLPEVVSSETENAIAEKVKEVLVHKKQNPSADTTALETQIDQSVYQLYDLTEEEIKIVEGNG
ncbi:MAG TPA: DUF559 domain-containing protein, partial [Bacteroidales bacterium]|nr:DUF559 domain-containing protein [Bacteroidales bacterium]